MTALPKLRTERKNRWKVWLALANAAIVTMILCLCIQTVNSQHTKQELAAEEAFATTVSSMHRVAQGYIMSQQQMCNDWAEYITFRKMNMEQAIEYLLYSNSVDGVMAHVVDYDTLRGVSTQPDANGKNTVDYATLASMLTPLCERLKGRPNDDQPNLTRSFTNHINAVQTIGFCQDVAIAGEEGQKHYMLMRLVPLSDVRGRWEFPAGYNGAELSLITAEGDYVVRSASMKNQNFWEYVRIYNHLGYRETENLRDDFYSDRLVLRQLNDSDGQTCYFVTVSDTIGADWYYVGYIPKAALALPHMDWTVVGIVIAGFVLLLLVDGSYILDVNQKLSRSVKEAECANQAKTQFLSSMSHDIRTPMNAIVGMTAIASRSRDDPEKLMDCLKKITLASNHLLTLINDVLDISKVESGKLKLNPTMFSLAELMENLVNIVRPQIREKGLRFDVDVHKMEQEYLFADELRLNQIFINLLTNAVKYTPAGGRVRLDLQQVIDPQNPQTVRLVYTVADTGIGMSKEFQKSMYETFSREADTRIDRIQGSGLGLAITRQMVDLMHGTISCESAVGKGTTFVVTVDLPVGDHATDEWKLPPMKILLADDDEIFLETAADIFESLGVEIDTVGDGKEAVQRVCACHEANNDYPVVIVDWRMPGMDGIAATRAIREQVGEETPIIVVSSYDWEEIEDEAIAAGANGFISKPFFRSTVYARMTELLSLKEHKESTLEDESDGEDLAGMHLLVAEDNDLNWEIIQQLLEISDITADRAENGQICVDMLCRSKPGTYDAVLMDVQMPVMNGREASRAIRSTQISWVRHIPIIAMTADAFSEDVAACLQAGMNSHVAKPVDMKKLFAALRKCCNRNESHSKKS